MDGCLFSNFEYGFRLKVVPQNIANSSFFSYKPTILDTSFLSIKKWENNLLLFEKNAVFWMDIDNIEHSDMLSPNELVNMILVHSFRQLNYQFAKIFSQISSKGLTKDEIKKLLYHLFVQAFFRKK